MLSRTRKAVICLLVIVFACLFWLAPIPMTSSQSVAPSITNLSPSTVRAGGSGLTLVVNGSGFTNGAVVRLNGSPRSTTFISQAALSASIPASDLLIVGTFSITVLNPNGSTSNSSNLTVTPSLINLSPMTAVAGSSTLTLTVAGEGFVNGSVVRWDGVNRTTTFFSAKKLTASIPASDLANVDTVAVTVLNPAPNNLTSNAVIFKVTDLPPATECPAGSDVTLSNSGIINSGPARSQMWRNGNIWWGAFSNNVDGIYFYKQTSPTTWERGALIDTNMVAGTFIAGSPDCLWTGTNLFVLIQESAILAKLYKYTYNSGSQTYSLISGFPINLALNGIGTSGSGKIYPNIALDQDSTGKLWAAYNGGGIGGDGNVRVIYSTSADHRTWDTNGIVLASGVSTANTEGTAIVRFGGNRIGVGWSNQVTSELAFRYHTDGQAVTSWSTKEIIDSGLGPEGSGDVAGKQLSMKAAPDGRIFLVADDNDGLNNHLHLYIRTTAGVWGSKTLVVNNFNAIPSKGVLLLDTDNSIIHVIYKDGAVSSNGLSGQTFITQSSMNNPSFNAPCLILDTSDDDAALSTSNPTSTKQNLTTSTDLIVAGSTGRNGNRILVNSVDLTPNVVSIFSISPKEVTAGESGFTLTVNGKLFKNGSVVRFNGSSRTTTFVNTTRLTASITSSNIANPGSYPIIVRNSNPTADSNAKNLVVSATNPVPTLNAISPKRELTGTPQFTMTLTGAGFRRTSVVRFNGSNRTTQFFSDTQLTATIPASDLLVPGSYPVTVFNPPPSGGSSTVTPITTFYVMPACNAPVGHSLPGITLFNTVKSQMWYHDGRWWGAFSDNVGGIFFYKQSGNTFSKGALLSTNFNGRPDVLWNGNHLFVLVYEFNALARLFKYTYNTSNDTYTLSSGFPVNLPLIGIGPGVSAAETGSITLAQDSRGKLWAAYPGSFIGGDGNYRVIWSTSADQKTWNTTGYIFDTGADVGTQEVAPIVHFGGDKIGIAYSKQPTKEVLFRYHVDGTPETSWSTTEIVDSGLGHLGTGGVADNHMSMRTAPDGRIFLVAKDSDGPGFINLYVRNAPGGWSNPVLVDVDPHAAVTRPVLALDLENSDLYVWYADAASNFLYMNKASMNNPMFLPACQYLKEEGVSDVTTTKQNLSASTGLLAVGSKGGATSTLHFNPLALFGGSGNVPVLSNISPSSVALDNGPFTLSVNGSNFNSGAIVYLNGMDRPTTFVSSTQLTARIISTDVETYGNSLITVMNPKGGTSAAVSLSVNPAINSLSPTSAAAGSNAFMLTVNGAGFANGAEVRFNGSARPTTFVSSTQLTAQIPATDVAAAGTPPVVVVNPGGGISPATPFTVNNLVPSLASIAPATQLVDTGPLTLTLSGANFVSSSVVAINGLTRSTTFVSTTQLTAQILATDVSGTGVFPITVHNPAPGGGTSAPLALAIVNPVPSISSLNPTSGTLGGAGFTLTVSGDGFVNGAVVRFNNIDRATTFVSRTQLTAQITGADLSVSGAFPITVFNPSPGGGVSNQNSFMVNNGIPVVSSISPSNKLEGEDAFSLTITGLNYVSGAVVRVNGSDRVTTYNSSTQLSAQISTADLQTAGTLAVTVFNPAPGGGLSNAIDLTVNNRVPTLTSINPTEKIAVDPAFTMTVIGTNFVGGSIVRFNGNDRSTTFVSSTQLIAQITASDMQAAGNYSVTVFNPAPGGGTSNATNFTVNANNPTPQLDVANAIVPSSRMAGEMAFTLTVNGSGFTHSSVVQWNGQARPTSMTNSTQLTAQILAADIAVAGTANLTVFNPPPGGGTSAAAVFNINVNPRTLQIPHSSGGATTNVSIPIQLTAQGDENAVGFSINYDPALLSNPQATLGVDALEGTLNSNSSQVTLGRYGMVLSLPAGQNFAAGARHILTVTFTAATVATLTTTEIGFGDQPVSREVSDIFAEPLSVAYIPGIMTITLGYEADVWPRPIGNYSSAISISDWTQSGRFAVGLDTPAVGSEFQRADCSPTSTMGNGRITISDWVQTGRYVAGMDPVPPLGGPTEPISATQTEAPKAPGGNEEKSALAKVTTINLLNRFLPAGQNSTVSIEVEAEGSENAFGFSLMFDPAQVSFVSAEKSYEASAATLNVNQQQAAVGRLGLVLALPPGRTFAASKHLLVVLNFTLCGHTSELPPIRFSDQPVAREVVDHNANSMKAVFQDGEGFDSLEDEAFFGAQQILDSHNPPVFGGRFDYWNQKISLWGTETTCVNNIHHLTTLCCPNLRFLCATRLTPRPL